MSNFFDSFNGLFHWLYLNEPDMINDRPSSEKVVNGVMSFVIILILFSGTLSAYFFSALIFPKSKFIITIFILFLFCNFYFLLLASVEGRGFYKRKVSYIVSILVLITLGVLVSKSLELKIFESHIAGYLQQEKIEMIENFKKTLNGENPEILASFKQTVRTANFAHLRVQILIGKFPISWVFTFFMTLLILVPYLNKLVRLNSSEYELDIYERDRDLINSEYRKFKEQYSKIFNGCEFYEAFEDAPFNTILKKDSRRFMTEKEFLKMVKEFKS